MESGRLGIWKISHDSLTFFWDCTLEILLKKFVVFKFFLGGKWRKFLNKKIVAKIVKSIVG